jgi:hypothetical protein
MFPASPVDCGQPNSLFAERCLKQTKTDISFHTCRNMFLSMALQLRFSKLYPIQVACAFAMLLCTMLTSVHNAGYSPL